MERASTFLFLTMVAPIAAMAHQEHMLVGRTAAGQLTWSPIDGVKPRDLTALILIPPGGVIEGFSAAIPGFSLTSAESPADDFFAPAAGVDIWLELVHIDVPLLLIETPSYIIVNELSPPRLRIGSDAAAHMHPLWLLDTTDPAFDPSRCEWEATFVFKDLGGTGYLASEPITLRFSAGSIPCPADFDCDSDVDEADLAVFQACAGGSNLLYDPQHLPEGCIVRTDHQGVIAPDLDRDGDVDQTDFGAFQRCLSGPGSPADANCGR